MISHELFIHIHQGCFAGTGAIVRLPQCQWSKPDGYGKISQCITTTKHSKAYFLGYTVRDIFDNYLVFNRKLKAWHIPTLSRVFTKCDPRTSKFTSVHGIGILVLTKMTKCAIKSETLVRSKPLSHKNHMTTPATAHDFIFRFPLSSPMYCEALTATKMVIVLLWYSLHDDGYCPNI